MAIRKIITKKYVKCSAQDTVSSVIGALNTAKSRIALVFEGKTFKGVVSRRNILSMGSDPSQTQISKCIVSVPYLEVGMNVQEASRLLLSSRAEAIPVYDKDTLLGVILDVDLVSLLVKDVQEPLLVEDLQLEKPSPLKKGDTVGRAVKILVKEYVDQALVFEDRSLFGVVSISDVFSYLSTPFERISNANKSFVGSRGAAVDRVKLSSFPVHSFATTRDLRVATRSTSLVDALRMMKRNNIRDLIIVEEEKVFGLLTVRLVMKFILNLMKESQLPIDFSGSSKLRLDQKELSALQDLCVVETRRFISKFGDIDYIKFRFKEMKSAGSRQKYSLHLQLGIKGSDFQTDAVEWDLMKAVKSCFKNLSVLLRKGTTLTRR